MKIFTIKSLLLYLLLGWILLSGCTTLQPLSLDILIPPDTLIYPGLKSATIVYQDRLIEISDSLSPKDNDSLVTAITFRKSLMEECILGLQEILKSSPGIDTIIVDSLTSNSAMLFPNNSDSIDSSVISDICINSKTDIVILLEGIFAWDTLFNSYIYHVFEDGSSEVVLYDNMCIILASRWSIYDTYSQNLLERYFYTDTVIWSSDVYQRLENTIGLPEPENGYLEAMYWAGNGYGKRIISTWESTDRFYYCTNNKLMKDACKKAFDNNWREAAIIWKELSRHKNKILAAKAALNMALVCELEDRLIPAQDWAIKSVLLNRNRDAENYLEIINSRIFIKKKYKF